MPPTKAEAEAILRTVPLSTERPLVPVMLKRGVRSADGTDFAAGYYTGFSPAAAVALVSLGHASFHPDLSEEQLALRAQGVAEVGKLLGVDEPSPTPDPKPAPTAPPAPEPTAPAAPPAVIVPPAPEPAPPEAEAAGAPDPAEDPRDPGVSPGSDPAPASSTPPPARRSKSKK